MSDVLGQIRERIEEFRRGCFFEPDFSIVVSPDVLNALTGNGHERYIEAHSLVAEHGGVDVDVSFPEGTVLIVSEGVVYDSDREDTPLDDLPFDIAAGDNPFVGFAEWWVGNGSDWATVAMMLAEAKKTAQANAMNEASQEDTER